MALVTGATGNVGREVVKLLLGDGQRVAAVTRKSSGAAAAQPHGADVVAPHQVRQAMLAHGVPEEVPDRLLGYLADRVQQPGPTSTAVEQILGRPARTFADWAAEHADVFRPTAHAVRSER